MRKILEAVALLAVLAAWGRTAYAFWGGASLPATIPIHFDGAGHPNGWVGQAMLWLFPVIATAVYAGLSVLARFPGRFNYPVLVTPHNRARLESLTVGLLLWLKAELACLFAWVQAAIIHSAREGRNALSPLFVPTVLIAVWTTVGYYIVATRRSGRRPSQLKIR